MEIDGLLIVDKPDGIPSLEAVKEVKRRLGVKKAGHIGTLDPFATGVLPIVMNEGTKLVPFIQEEPKEYEATLKLGEETETDDRTGKVISRNAWEEIDPASLERTVNGFSGKLEQVPPMYSAIKVKGKPLYRLARKGIDVERKERPVEIFSIRVKEITLPLVRIQVSCSRGTYIRALGRDIGKRLGCGAHLVHLRRVRSGPFTLERSVSWERLTESSGEKNLLPWLIPLKEALPGLPEMIGDEGLVRKVRFGREMVVRDVASQSLPPFEKGQWLKMSSPEGGLIAILKSEVGDTDLRRAGPEVVAFRPLRVFRPFGGPKAYLSEWDKNDAQGEPRASRSDIGSKTSARL
jgi:tRNA pseudouridine55 synthase